MASGRKTIGGDSVEKLMENLTRCSICGRILSNNTNFYVSSSKANKFTGRLCTCKDCLTNLYIEYLTETEDVKMSIYKICRIMDILFLNNMYESALNEVGWNENFTIIQNGLEVWKKYIKNINSLKQNKGYTFEHGEQIDVKTEEESETQVVIQKPTELSEEELSSRIRDKQNREDIIRMIGYDPFQNEKECDKSYFYSRLIDMMTEDMQNDSMKLTSVISIIKAQKQVDKIDDAISELMDNPITMVQKAGDIKSLATTKKDLQKSILDNAKDNRISDLYSGQKTVGANTLSGIVKKLKELNLTEAQVNLYDIQTSMGMQQVANLSTKAIVDQLMFAENEYADMVAYQRGQMQHYEKMYKQLAEENRKLKVLCNTNNIDYKGDVFVDTMYEDSLSYDEKILGEIKDEKEELDKIIESVLPMSVIDYAEKVIEEKENIEKQKIIDGVLNT